LIELPTLNDNVVPWWIGIPKYKPAGNYIILPMHPHVPMRLLHKCASYAASKNIRSPSLSPRQGASSISPMIMCDHITNSWEVHDLDLQIPVYDWIRWSHLLGSKSTPLIEVICGSSCRRYTRTAIEEWLPKAIWKYIPTW